jgi:hypothetical protein
VAAEVALIADVDSALGTAHPRIRRSLRAIRADHVAHLTALRAAIVDDVYPLAAPSPFAAGSASVSASNSAASGSASGPSSPGASRSASSTAGAPVPVSDIRAGELRASRGAAARAARMSGRDAALLASIAASEASHAELLA